MLLKEIFARKIGRPINPAVVVSDSKIETIEAEIEEYVFTDELIDKLITIVDTVLNKRTGKSGIWINGYYGSGKSHFIKFIHYLFNQETSALAFGVLEKAIEKYDTTKPGNRDDITVSNIKLLKKKIESSQSDNILFNVEDETDDGDQERLTRIFMNMFNKFRGYNSNDIPLAILLEKPLDKKGVFQEFKNKIDEEMGFDWEVDAAQVASFQLESVLEIAKSVFPELDIVSLHAKLSNPENYKIGINATLIPELQAFLKEKEANYKLVFLVDEVSQYVGSNKEILLNFQNIIERISDDCNNQVWIACTAQQTLDEVSIGADGVQDVQDEFGKILGRFDTRISLQSNDASYITQKRVLDKSSNGIEALVNMYSSNKDYIENQFKISHELYKGYQNEGQFVLAYPFVPYQFKLIAHVFEAFQQLQFVIKEVKDNERSVLGITHFTAKEHANDEFGDFMSFDAFYNRQFHTNLTNRGAKAIENGLELPYVKSNPFAEKVVKVLFMISNLLENQRQTFPSNIDNLAVLLMNKLDQNKKQLQKEITEVLNKLLEESIIREENGSYFFFNEDEMDVQNLIKNQIPNSDTKLEIFDKDFFRPLVKIAPKITFGQNDFKMSYAIEGKEFFRGGDFNMSVLLTDSTPIAQKALDLDKKELVICLNSWFTNDETLRKDFDWYGKTIAYFSNNGGGTGERSKTNDNFRIRNKQLKGKIEESIKQKFSETHFISQNAVLSPDQINGTTAQDRVKNVIEHHLAGIYKNHKASAEFARNQQELKKSAADKQVLMPTLSPAEIFVNDFISLNNNQISVEDVIKNFAKEPFGWRFEAVLDVLVNLVKKKKREFVYKGQQRYPIVDFINKAVVTSERSSCQVVTGEDIDQAVLDKVIKVYKSIFNEPLQTSTDGNELFDNLKAALNTKLVNYQPFEKEYHGAYPFGNCFNEAVRQLTDWGAMRDPKQMFNRFIEAENSAKELFDKTKGIQDFTSRNRKEYDNIQGFYTANKENFKELPANEQEKALKMEAFLKLDDPRKEFRHIRKAHDELKEALNKITETLKEEVIKIYNGIFEELNNEAAKRKVDVSCFADKEYTLNGIKVLESIATIKNKKLGASDFKASELQKIIAATPVAVGEKKTESVTYNITKRATTITTNDEMEAYLNTVKKEMSVLLAANKTIILK